MAVVVGHSHDMDWSSIITLAAGLAVGWVAGLGTAFLAPVQRWAARFGRRFFRDDGVRIVVETDVDIIFSGLPDWETLWSFRPGPIPVEGPPRSRSGWQAWVASGGGLDYWTSTVAITIIAESDVTVVMRPPTAVVHGCEPAGEGVVLARYAGGASITPLGFDIDLDGHPEVSILTNADGIRLDPPLRWSLRKGDVQTVLLRVHSSAPGVWTWSARIPFLIEGRSVVKDTTDIHGKFVLVGRDPDLPGFTWDGHEWRRELAANP